MEKSPSQIGDVLKQINPDLIDPALAEKEKPEEKEPGPPKTSIHDFQESVIPGEEDISSFVELDDEKDASQNKANLNFDPSSFDINMAEFPIAHLSQRLPEGISKTEIKYSDFIKDGEGKLVKRKWTIRSNAKITIKDKEGNEIEEVIGLGGPTSLQVFYEILQIWREQGFKEHKINIGTYYNLLKRLGWGTGGDAYLRLERDLNSLYDIEFIAENAYYDKDLNRLVNKKIKLFEGFTVYKKKDDFNYLSDYGYIAATHEFHESIKNKTSFFLPFERDYFKTLTPHEQKLALYLSKVFNPYRKRTVLRYNRNIFELCRILPIYGEKRKQKYYLVKATKGLIAKEFILLDDYSIDGDVIIFFNRLQQSLLPYLKTNIGQKTNQNIEFLIEDMMKVCGDKHSIRFYELVAREVPEEIIYRCLSEAKQEGKDPKKLFTKIIREQGRKYLEKFLNYKEFEKEEQEVNA